MLLERMERDELVTEHLATHVLPLDEGPKGYDVFKNREDNRVRAVFVPERGAFSPQIMDLATDTPRVVLQGP